MASWGEFAAAEPEFAERVRRRFTAHKHCTLATLRQDGSPRISGTEVELREGELELGMMPGSVKALDLRRDSRLALHSATEDPPEEDPSSWVGEAKIAGRAVEMSDPREPAQPHRFRVDIGEVVLTRVGQPPDHLVIESWHPDRGLERRERR
ncbi:MAG: pyridoxamine 5'-phosphate oxidase family protein [Actinomycetota bacterium]